MNPQSIPFVNLNIDLHEQHRPYSKLILGDEIAGIQIEHFILNAGNEIRDLFTKDFKTIYIFMKGNGNAIVKNKNYKLKPETILLPNNAKNLVINSASDDSLHYLKITSELTLQDQLDLKDFPIENTQNVYYAKFKDCQSYTEPIKSPNTISRTILSNKIIPRIAMGTVHTKGPDEVGAHKHPMLEQLFLGLSKNKCVVYADDAEVNFLEYSVLHIPLGSIHSVTVEKDELMYYVWMDFFLDKSGEEWLETHILDEES